MGQELRGEGVNRIGGSVREGLGSLGFGGSDRGGFLFTVGIWAGVKSSFIHRRVWNIWMGFWGVLSESVF